MAGRARRVPGARSPVAARSMSSCSGSASGPQTRSSGSGRFCFRSTSIFLFRAIVKIHVDGLARVHRRDAICSIPSRALLARIPRPRPNPCLPSSKTPLRAVRNVRTPAQRRLRPGPGRRSWPGRSLLGTHEPRCCLPFRRAKFFFPSLVLPDESPISDTVGNGPGSQSTGAGRTAVEIMKRVYAEVTSFAGSKAIFFAGALLIRFSVKPA